MSSSPSVFRLNLRRDLRRELRARRRALSTSQQRLAARKLQQQLQKLPELDRAQRIALYWPNDGEIDPRLLVTAKRHHQQLYLPALQSFPALTLRFVRWTPRLRMTKNRFGIPELRRGARLPAQAMDVILMPLVGFDADGNRLGMGGGFYDRTLAFVQRAPRPLPVLIGVAHQCQQETQLTTAAWDIPLQLIVTDKKVIRP